MFLCLTGHEFYDCYNFNQESYSCQVEFITDLFHTPGHYIYMYLLRKGGRVNWREEESIAEGGRVARFWQVFLGDSLSFLLLHIL